MNPNDSLTDRNHYEQMRDVNGRKRRRCGGISVFKPPVQDAFECEGEELEALTCVKLVLELHPAQRIKNRQEENRSAGVSQITSQTHGGDDGQAGATLSGAADDLCSPFHRPPL